jgi:hypothetical protein
MTSAILVKAAECEVEVLVMSCAPAVERFDPSPAPIETQMRAVSTTKYRVWRSKAGGAEQLETNRFRQESQGLAGIKSSHAVLAENHSLYV